MQVSNDWPIDEPFGGPGLSPCVVPICEHSVEIFECEICLETQPSFKKREIKKNYRIYSLPIMGLGIKGWLLRKKF